MKQNTKSKIKTLKEVLAIAEKAHKEKKMIVTTNGCFDILHAGHVQNLEWASREGDMFIVGINSDASVRANKGPARPIVPAHERARVIAGLACVDYVFIFGGKSPIPWLRRIKPSVHVKGQASKSSAALLPEQEAVEQNGGAIRLAPELKGLSTTHIIETILLRHSSKQ